MDTDEKKNAAKIATMSTSTLKSEKPPQITLRLKHISKLQKLTSQCSKTTDSFIGTATALAEAIYCITCVIYGRLLLFFWSFFEIWLCFSIVTVIEVIVFLTCFGVANISI